MISGAMVSSQNKEQQFKVGYLYLKKYSLFN
jgi:hypothetical protein